MYLCALLCVSILSPHLLHGAEFEASQVVAAETTYKLIQSVRVEKNKITIIPHENFASYFKEPAFVVEYDNDVDLSHLDESVISLPFIMICAPMVWASGKKFEIDRMDKDMYLSLQKIKYIFTLFLPTINWSGELIPRQLVENKPSAKSRYKTALLYSGGLDSTSMAFAHQKEKHLLITLCGIDIPFNHKERWDNIKIACKKFGARLGHANAFVRSNTCSAICYNFLKCLPDGLTKWWWWDYALPSLGFVGLTAPLLVQKGCTSLLFASSNTLDFPYPLANHPLVDNNLCFAGINVHHEQGHMTRIDKIAFISKCIRNEPKPHLRVCWLSEEGGNCGTCEKCLRTINALLVFQEDIKAFGFDIPVRTAMEKTLEFMTTKLDSYNSGIRWEWQNIQDFAEDNLHIATWNYDPVMIAYIKWLANVPFPQSFVDGDSKNYFERLWVLGLASPLDLEQLKSFCQ